MIPNIKCKSCASNFSFFFTRNFNVSIPNSIVFVRLILAMNAFYNFLTLIANSSRQWWQMTWSFDKFSDDPESRWNDRSFCVIWNSGHLQMTNDTMTYVIWVIWNYPGHLVIWSFEFVEISWWFTSWLTNIIIKNYYRTSRPFFP